MHVCILHLNSFEFKMHAVLQPNLIRLLNHLQWWKQAPRKEIDDLNASKTLACGCINTSSLENPHRASPSPLIPTSDACVLVRLSDASLHPSPGHKP